MDLSGTAAARLAAIERGSISLAAFARDDPHAMGFLTSSDELPDREAYVADAHAAWERGGAAELRLQRRRRLLEIAARDLAGEVAFERVGAALSHLADGCLAAVLRGSGAEGAVTVIGMGKLGGEELNYSSDIDVMFVAAAAVGAAVTAASELLEVLGAVSPQGQAYRIDTKLRPEGRSGALVRSLESYLEYYERWAKAWEHQALIKARVSAGDQKTGDTFLQETRAIVFVPDISDDRIAQIRSVKARLEEHSSRSARRAKSDQTDDVKLGPGGIRDIEFSVQLLQLVHGGTDPLVRSPNTLTALTSLVDEGYIADDDGAGLGVAYRWLRNVEHRVQLRHERQVHHLPRGAEERRAVALSLGFADSADASATERFDEAHNAVLSDVRARFEKLFYRPMVESLSDAAGPHLSLEALKARLQVLGFRDVDRAARTLDGLVSGASRRAKLLRVLTPALLRWLAAAPTPDDGLFSFLRLGEALQHRLDVLGAMRDNPPGLQFLARVLGSGRFAGDLLTLVPDEIATIAAGRTEELSRDREQVFHEARASLEWRDPAEWPAGLRRYKRRAVLRIVLADVAGYLEPGDVGHRLSDVADAVMEAAMTKFELRLAVVGMGKLGGRELQYSSDIDVMFVHDADPVTAERMAEQLIKVIGEMTPEGQAFRIDPALRPEGRSGPLVRSLQSYLDYYERWSRPWEHLALIKARPSSGDVALAQALVDATRGYAFPEQVGRDAVQEIRHLKARMEKERLPRGIDARRHFKLGPGGLSDVEFAVQMSQLRHGAAVPSLRVPGTVEALDAAAAAGVLDPEDVAVLTGAYAFLTRVRNGLFLLTGRPVDVFPARPEDLEALGIAMGFRDQPRQELEEAYLRTTRRCRRVAEPLIYGP